MEGTDILFDAPQQGCGIDVKSFDCAPNKRYFAINDNKHRTLAGQCSRYLCVIVPPAGRRMAVCRLVPYAEVDGWSVDRLRRGGSASRNLPFERFLATHFSEPPSIEKLRGSTFSTDEIDPSRADPTVRWDFAAFVPRVPLPALP